MIRLAPPQDTRSALLARHQSLSVFLYLSRETPHCGRTTHQLMISHLSKTGLTSCNQMVKHGCVHFALSQNIVFLGALCMRNQGKCSLLQMLGRSFIDSLLPKPLRYSRTQIFTSTSEWSLNIIMEQGMAFT